MNGKQVGGIAGVITAAAIITPLFIYAASVFDLSPAAGFWTMWIVASLRSAWKEGA
jgi:hypothetical protein